MDFFTIRINIDGTDSGARFTECFSGQDLYIDSGQSAISYSTDGKIMDVLVGISGETSHGHKYPDPVWGDGHERLTEGIARYVVEVKEAGILSAMLSRKYSFASAEDYEAVWKLSLRLLGTDEAGLSARRTRMSLIKKELKKHLQQSAFVHLDGLITFRLREYINKLDEIIDYAVDELLLDKQYEEFIGLLQYFVHFQEPLTPLVHLMHKKDQEFVVLDEKFTSIHIPAGGGMVARIADQELEMENAVVSSLISLAPVRILIHTPWPEMQMISTICQIFGERVEICSQCPQCTMFHQSERSKDQCT
ncbi:putative sporulation protein YtxC [Paenibacillus lutimineralis]|nr:putative sporulation protein YtxC [Paenibacillus lutimineralis]